MKSGSRLQSSRIRGSKVAESKLVFAPLGSQIAQSDVMGFRPVKNIDGRTPEVRDR